MARFVPLVDALLQTPLEHHVHVFIVSILGTCHIAASLLARGGTTAPQLSIAVSRKTQSGVSASHFLFFLSRGSGGYGRSMTSTTWNVRAASVPAVQELRRNHSLLRRSLDGMPLALQSVDVLVREERGSSFFEGWGFRKSVPRNFDRSAS